MTSDVIRTVRRNLHRSAIGNEVMRTFRNLDIRTTVVICTDEDGIDYCLFAEPEQWQAVVKAGLFENTSLFAFRDGDRIAP